MLKKQEPNKNSITVLYMLNGYRIYKCHNKCSILPQKKKKRLKICFWKVTVWRAIIFELLWSGEEGDLYEMRKSLEWMWMDVVDDASGKIR